MVDSVGYSGIVRYFYGKKQYAAVYAETQMFNSLFTGISTSIIGRVYDLAENAIIPLVFSATMAVCAIGLITLHKYCREEK